VIAQAALATAAAVAALFAAVALRLLGRRLAARETMRRRLRGAGAGGGWGGAGWSGAGGAGAGGGGAGGGADGGRGGGDPRTRPMLRAGDEGAGPCARLLAGTGLGWTPSGLVARSAAAAAAGASLGALLGGPVLALGAGAAGLAAPSLHARRARARRQRACDREMPQVLEIVALALRAGHPLATALGIAAAESPAPIGEELRRACDEHDLGRPVADVLVALAERLPGCESAHAFVTAVLVLEQTGGNLIAVVDRIVESARGRAQYRQKLRALTAEGRSSARMLSFMPVAFASIAAAIDPGYAGALLRTRPGNLVAATTLALWLLGILWTRRLVRGQA
jgi:tight adherence protein B